MNRLRAWWEWFLANHRLSLRLVCELSKDKGPFDYHDYPDDEFKTPWHFTPLKCVRCGKTFYM